MLGGWNSDHATPSSTLLRNVGIDQKLGDRIPLNLKFRDESGHEVRLGNYFGKRPVILTLVYFECPSLCTMVLNDLTKTLNAMSTTVGKDFDIVTVSFNPKEGPKLAAEKKKQYLRAYRRPAAAAGWHFLTGDQASIKALTKAVGFRYVWDPTHKQFLHASGIMVTTPQGKLARYFFGVQYSAKDLRLALLGARSGKTFSPVAVILCYCFQYDPTTGRYTLAVMRLIRIGGVLTLLGLGSLAFVLFRKERATAAVTEASGTPPRLGSGRAY